MVDCSTCVLVSVMVSLLPGAMADGWVSRDNKDYKVFDFNGTTFDDAKSLCATNGAILPEPKNLQENNYLANLNVSIAFVVIGIIKSGGAWVYNSDWSTVTRSRWMSWANGWGQEPHDDPNYKENCAVLLVALHSAEEGFTRGGWSSVGCGSLTGENGEKSQHVICERVWIPKGKHSYKVLPHTLPYDKAKDKAKSLCSQHGGMLPEPRDEEENNYLASLGSEKFYLGMMNDSGQWTWESDGTAVTWVNWGPSDIGTVGRKCAVMLKNHDDTVTGHRPEAWDHYPCDVIHGEADVVCQKIFRFCPDGFSLYGKQCYRLFHTPEDNITQPDAAARCEHSATGAFLAEPLSEAEHKEIQRIMDAANVDVAWLGGTDKVTEGTWQWPHAGWGFVKKGGQWQRTDGSDVYTGFMIAPYGERPGGKDCMIVLADIVTAWGDVECSNRQYFMCQTHSTSPITSMELQLDPPSANVGDTVTLTCAANGDPAPTYVFVKCQVEANQSKVNGGVLVLDHVMPEDEGAYTCIAENIHGHVDVTIKLHVWAPTTTSSTSLPPLTSVPASSGTPTDNQPATTPSANEPIDTSTRLVRGDDCTNGCVGELTCISNKCVDNLEKPEIEGVIIDELGLGLLIVGIVAAVVTTCAVGYFFGTKKGRADEETGRRKSGQTGKQRDTDQETTGSLQAQDGGQLQDMPGQDATDGDDMSIHSDVTGGFENFDLSDGFGG